MGDPGMVSVWLGIIAIVLLIQLLILIAAVVVAMRVYHRAVDALDAYERQHVSPLLRRVHAGIDDLQEVLGRVRSADDNVRHAWSRTTERAGQAAARLRAGFWPMAGLGRGVWAALASFRRRQPRPADVGPEGEAHIAYQGGTSHVRS